MKYRQYLLVIILGLFIYLGFLPTEALANRAFNGTVYNYLSVPVQGVDVEIWGKLDHCEEQVAEGNLTACDHRYITTMTSGSDGRFTGGVGCVWLNLMYAIPSFSIPLSDFGGEDDCETNSCYTAGNIYLPEPKNCNVSVSPNTAETGGSMNITYSGRGWAPNEKVRVLMTKQDFSEFTGSSGGSGNYYKVLARDCPVNTSCSVLTPTDLEPGVYYAHCDLASEPGRCSGAKICEGDGSGYSDLSGPFCSGWKSCGDYDYTAFSVYSGSCPTPSPGTGPRINGLVTTKGIDAAPGLWRLSGNRSSEGGSNFYNELTITAYGKAGSRPIERIYAIFYDQNAYPGGIASSYQELLDRISASPKEGFILAYGTNINGDPDSEWYVRDRNTWKLLSAARDPLGGNVLDGAIVYNVWGDQNSSILPLNQAGWNVEFKPGFESKTMKTAVYLEDAGFLSAFSHDVVSTQNPPTAEFDYNGCPL